MSEIWVERDGQLAREPASTSSGSSDSVDRETASSVRRRVLRTPSPAPAFRTTREAVAGTAQGTGVSKVTARKMVLVSVFVLAAINVYHERRGGSQVSFYRRLWGTGLVGIFLALLADFAPQVAGPLAAVIVLSQVPTKGDQALQQLLGRVAQAGPAGPQGTAPTGPQPAGPQNPPP